MPCLHGLESKTALLQSEKYTSDRSIAFKVRAKYCQGQKITPTDYEFRQNSKENAKFERNCPSMNWINGDGVTTAHHISVGTAFSIRRHTMVMVGVSYLLFIKNLFIHQMKRVI